VTTESHLSHFLDRMDALVAAKQADVSEAARVHARTDPWRDLARDTVSIGGRTLSIVLPRDSEALLDEEAFEREEFLPYWAQLWPSAIVLARATATLRPAGRRVLELGCGLGLPSIAAALEGASVLATDWSPDAVAFAAANASRNGAALRTAVCSWAQPQRLVAEAPWDLVLAADVLYESRNVDQLLELLPRLVDGSGEVLIADPGRRPAERFLRATATPASGWLRRSTRDRSVRHVTVHRLRRDGAGSSPSIGARSHLDIPGPPP
jgi:predicted nicotinamide N-methyase